MKQSIQFSKMHGLGNDFVVIDAISQTPHLDTEQIQALADRHTGIGFDQLLLVERSHRNDADFRYRIFNANGGEVAQCGNGVRCFARFVRDKGLTTKDEIAVETSSGLVYPRIESDGQVRVNMGVPDFDPATLPFRATRQPRYSLSVDAQRITLGAVSMGNPHAVVVVDEIDSAPVDTLGPAISHHDAFPCQVNAGFMQILNPGHIRLRVFERGAGETRACGTGACAAVAVGRLWQQLQKEVTVDLPGGQLLIRWDDPDSPLWMTGPATHVFEGTIEL